MTPRVPFYPKYNTLNKRLIKEIWLQFCYRAFRILRTLSNIVYFKFIWIPWYIKPRQKTLLHRQKGMGKKHLQLLGCSIGFSTFGRKKGPRWPAEQLWSVVIAALVLLLCGWPRVARFIEESRVPRTGLFKHWSEPKMVGWSGVCRINVYYVKLGRL